MKRAQQNTERANDGSRRKRGRGASSTASSRGRSQPETARRMSMPDSQPAPAVPSTSNVQSPTAPAVPATPEGEADVATFSQPVATQDITNAQVWPSSTPPSIRTPSPRARSSAQLARATPSPGTPFQTGRRVSPLVTAMTPRTPQSRSTGRPVRGRDGSARGQRRTPSSDLRRAPDNDDGEPAPSSARGSVYSPSPSRHSLGEHSNRRSGNGEDGDALAVQQLRTQLNEYKIRVTKLEQTAAQRQEQCTVLTNVVMELKKKLSTLETENAALKKLTDDMLSERPTGVRKSKRPSKVTVQSTVPKVYLGIALAVEKRISKWASAEVREVMPFQEKVERNWKGRGEVVTTIHRGGVDIGGGVKVVPICPEIVVSRGQMFSPSLENDVDRLDLIVTKELEDGSWGDVFPTEEKRADLVNVIVSNKALFNRLRQCLSDMASSRKRNARDFYFSQLGYDRLLSRFVSNANNPLSSKSGQVSSFRAKLDGKAKEIRISNLSLWRTISEENLLFKEQNEDEIVPAADVGDEVGVDGGIRQQEDGDGNSGDVGDEQEYARDDDELREDDGRVVTSTGEEDLDGERVAQDEDELGGIEQELGENLNLFSGTTSAFTFKEFLGYDPKNNGGGGDVVTSIVSLARLDAWIGTLVTQLGLTGDRSGTGGQVQKAYTNMFGEMLPVALSQIIGTIRRFVEHWEPRELSVSSAERVEDRKDFVLSMERDATCVFTNRESSEWFIAVKPSWFKQYITEEMGTVCDCVIATLSADFSSITKRGV